MRRLARFYNARMRHFNWKSLIDDNDSIFHNAIFLNSKGPRIVIPTCVGSQIGSSIFESMLAVALTLRGVQVEFLLCDASLPACMGCETDYLGKLTPANTQFLARAFCPDCFLPAFKCFLQIGLPVRRFSDMLTKEELYKCRKTAREIPLASIRDYRVDDLPIGEHAFAGALRFYARGDLKNEPFAEKVLRQYLEASLITMVSIENLFQTHYYECAVFNHGIYIPQGIIGAVCRKRKIRVVNWNPAYRKKCFIFSHGDTYHHTMVSEPTAVWETMLWDSQRERKLMEYLASRWRGTQDWIWFHESPIIQVEKVLYQMGVNPKRPLVGLLTSVMWDAALHYPSNAFPNMLSWVFHSIEYFRERRDLQLLIRVHPAEIQGGLPSRQRIAEEIRYHYPDLPNNIFVIPPESRLSTYAVMQKCNAVIIYNTKTGIELAAMGIPVIVAGEAWIRNKGFSIDVSSPEEYTKALDCLPFRGRMTEAETTRARKYAYHFFFRRMIPIEFMEPTGGNPPFRMRINNLDELSPGKNKGLDLICDGIVHGTDFIYDEIDPDYSPMKL